MGLKFFAVFLGGGLGSALRYALTFVFPNEGLPFATFTANILSGFFLGMTTAIVIGLSPERADQLRAFLIIGLCGGFSTFSTFSNENLMLMQDGNWLSAAAYSIASLVLCIGAILFGLWAGRLLL